MSHIGKPNDNTYSHSQINDIDQICDEYEEQLRTDQDPKIEVFLCRVSEDLRYRLLRDLVAVDFDFVRQRRPIEFSEYFKRFPDATQVLLDVQQDLNNEQETKVPGVDGVPDFNPYDKTRRPKLRGFKMFEIAGTGGFGAVWHAMDLSLQREVAVKIPRGDRAHLSEFLREARTAANLKHPNIVQVHEVGEESGTSFIVTEYIDGENLRDWHKHHTIGPDDVARLIAKLAMAIQHAHDHGVIHRDLKLANVLMDSRGEPHIADFGLAKCEMRDDSIAVSGQVLGTPAYMAPEQARADHGATDRRTDVYAIGVMMYELLTGTTPFRGDLEEMLRQIVDIAPIPPRNINREIPKDLEAICLKCLAKSNAKRYDTAQALADDLHLYLGGETLRGVPVAMPHRVWKWLRRNRKSVTTTATVASITAILAGGLMAWRYQSSMPAVPRYPVEFTTDPPGCEITVVACDADTHEPDPSKIEKARGRTPLKMKLPSGDYWVTAVLDNQRFNEVFRHVPANNEAAGMGQYVHLKWTRKSDGTVAVPAISIPRPDVTVDMGFCEGTESLIEPGTRSGSSDKQWRLPPLYVDRRMVSTEDLTNWKPSNIAATQQGTQPIALLSHYRCVYYLEEIGKRLPTAAELYYLSNNVCPPVSEPGEQTSPCVLSDKSLLEDLHSEFGEWTSSTPGSPFTGTTALPKTIGPALQTYVYKCGSSNSQESVSKTGFRVGMEHTNAAGFRGVRSAKPRLTPQDFPAIRKPKSNP